MVVSIAAGDVGVLDVDEDPQAESTAAAPVTERPMTRARSRNVCLVMRPCLISSISPVRSFSLRTFSRLVESAMSPTPPVACPFARRGPAPPSYNPGCVIARTSSWVPQRRHGQPSPDVGRFLSGDLTTDPLLAEGSRDRHESKSILGHWARIPYSRLRQEGGRMARALLDDTDRRIIMHLQEDGRRPYTTIAADLGLSEASIRQRVARLVQRKVIQIVAASNPLDLGLQKAELGNSGHRRLTRHGSRRRSPPSLRSTSSPSAPARSTSSSGSSTAIVRSCSRSWSTRYAACRASLVSTCSCISES